MRGRGYPGAWPSLSFRVLLLPSNRLQVIEMLATEVVDAPCVRQTLYVVCVRDYNGRHCKVSATR